MPRLLLFTAFLFAPALIPGQTRSEIREIFVEAESHFIYREYENAVLLYPILDDGENANIFYKIGVCFLHIPGEKEKAISYLEKAVRNASYDSKDHLYSETRAPLDAYFYLGNAYRINNELDKAIATYQKFKQLIQSDNPMVNAEFIDQEIRACEIAKEIETDPRSFIPENLGEEINLVSINLYPAVSGNESVLAYTAKFGEDNVIYYSTKTGNHWNPAVEITKQLAAGRDASTCALSFDGKELYVYREDNQIGNLFVSDFSDGTWGRLRKLNRNINTKYFESHACISSDGNTLYFSSNRPGGSGELDLYLSQKTVKGDWGPAVNLGNTINSPFNENHPFITENDSLLFYSSEGHYNMGGYDIFVSQRQTDGSWGKPENIGYPVNTTDDDLFFNPVNNGKAGYLSMTESYKQLHIYRLEILPRGVTRDFSIRGTISLKDTVVELDEGFTASLLDVEKDLIVNLSYPDRKGLYSISTKSGRYEVYFEGPGYETHVENIVINEYARKSEFVVDVALNPMKKIEVQKWLRDSVSIQDMQLLDTAMVIRDLAVEDLGDVDIDREVLYYTIQLMALMVRPVDVSYFSPLQNVRVILGKDGFYRYTYGEYASIEAAGEIKQQLIDMGFSSDLWVKRVYKEDQ